MIAQFHFLRPLWLLALIPLAWLLWRYWRQRQRANNWQSVCDPHLLPHLLVNSQGQISRTPLWLLGCAGLLSILALAGPTWSRLPQPVFRNTAATVVLFNLSQSMNAPDVTPTRLERAKLKLLDFLHSRHEGQTALIAYAGEAYVVSPLTDDAATIASQVNALAPNIMPVNGNNLAQALTRAQALLDQDGVYRGGRLLLITDSAGGTRALKQVKTLRRKGRVLSVLAVGTTHGAPIKASGGGFVHAADGSILIPRLKLAPLRKLAAAGHGHLVGLTTSDADLKALWPSAQSTRINSQHPDHNHAADIWREQGPWLLLLVLPLVALSWRRGWLALVLLALLPLPHPAQASTWTNLWSRPDQQAYHALQQGKAKTAARLFKDRNWRSIAQYRAGNYAAAAAGFAGQTSPDALYNQGNALAHLGKLAQAAQNYRKVLKQQPHNQDARHNLAIVEKLLRQRHSQQKSRNSKNHHGKTGKKSAKQSGKSSGTKSRQGKQGNQNGQHHGQSGNRHATASSRQTGQAAKHKKNSQQAKAGDRHKRGAHSDARDKTRKAQNQNGAKQQAQHKTAKSGQEKNGKHAQNPQAVRQAHTHSGNKSPVGRLADKNRQKKESNQALQQWLRRIPDDPGGLLRRKFMYLHELRQQEANKNGN